MIGTTGSYAAWGSDEKCPQWPVRTGVGAFQSVNWHSAPPLFHFRSTEHDPTSHDSDPIQWNVLDDMGRDSPCPQAMHRPPGNAQGQAEARPRSPLRRQDQ